MKIRHGFLSLALVLVGSANAADTYVRPVQEQTVESVSEKDSAVTQVCAKHLDYIRNQNSIIGKADGEGCKKVAALFMDAVNAGAEACTASFDVNVRDVMQKSLIETIQVQGLQCTAAQALAQPCEDCKGTITGVSEITTWMSTQDIDNSWLNYCGPFRNPKERKDRVCHYDFMAKLQDAANQASCSQFKGDQLQKMLAGLVDELRNAQIGATRYHVGPVKEMSSKISVPQTEPKLLGQTRTELPPVRVNSGPGDGVANIPPVSTADPKPAVASLKQAAPGLGVTGKLSNGGVGYVYSDPNDPNKNYVGYQIIDPKTKKRLTYAYPVPKEIADAIAKDPTLCDRFITTVQNQEGLKKSYSEKDALKNGEALFASLEKQKNGKKDSAPNASNAPSGTAVASQDKQGAGAGSSVVAGNSGAGNSDSGNASNVSSARPSDRAPAQKDLGSGVPVYPTGGMGLKAPYVQDAYVNGGLPSAPSVFNKVSQSDAQNAQPKDQPSQGIHVDYKDDMTEGSLERMGSQIERQFKNQEQAKSDTPSKSDAQPKAEAQSSSSSKPKTSKPKKVAAKKKGSAQSQASSKASAKSADQKKSGAPSSTVVFTGEGVGQVRYFIVNHPPFLPYVGRVIEVNGKSQIIAYRLPSDSQVKELTQNYEKLKKAFEDQNRTPIEVAHQYLLDQGISNQALTPFLIEALKK